MKRIWIGIFCSFSFFAIIFGDFSTPPDGIAIAQTKVKREKKNKRSQGIESEVNHFSSSHSDKAIRRIFVVPPELKTAVDFWKMVYTKYDRNFEIFHDTEKLNVIYSVMDFSDLYNNDALTPEERKTLFQPRMDAEEARIKDLLLHIHELQYQPEKLSKEEHRIWECFKDDPNPNKFLEAADEKRIRAQTGIRNKFIDAVRYSGAYIDEFEEIFSNNGLPIELTRLAIVESMFNTRAQSKVGASGIWQFMPTTGKLYGLVINRYVDERNDPIRATQAAALLLKSNFDVLGTWPLAINAYNSGRATMSHAVNTMGTTDIATIITNYHAGVYGFASRNFYPSFLAALEVANHYPMYLGEIQRDEKFVYDTYYVKNPIRFGDLATGAGVLPEVLMEYNPYFQEEVVNDLIKLPSGQEVRIPKGSGNQFAQAELKAAQGFREEAGTAQAP
jgi:peptidoglycan lytic transglycosylase D